MKVDKNTLDKIAHLSRLEIEPQNEKPLLESLSDILTWVEKLNELDTENIEPLTNISQEINAIRKDEVGKHLDRESGLKNAPDHSKEFFKVPKVKD